MFNSVVDSAVEVYSQGWPDLLNNTKQYNIHVSCIYYTVYFGLYIFVYYVWIVYGFSIHIVYCIKVFLLIDTGRTQSLGFARLSRSWNGKE